jgi:WD40 repeat protein
MATGSAGGRNLALWDLHKNAPFGWQPPSVRRPAQAGLPWNSVALSDRGLVAWAFGADPMTLDVWDLARQRHVGTQLTFPGVPVGLTFSPDGRQLAVTLDHSNSDLTVQLVSVPGMTPGPLLQGQDEPNAFNGIADQFESAAVFSPDGRQVSVVASRGRTAQRAAYGATIATKGSAIATFDTRTGARLPAPTIAVGQEFLGVSPDLHEIATLAGTDIQHTFVRVTDTRTGAQLAQLPVSSPNSPPVAFDPVRPRFVAQAALGALTVTDWTQAGAPHFAQASEQPGSAVELPANGTPIDLTEALRTLGLSSRCFAPLMSNCDYHLDQRTKATPENIPFAGDIARRPWTATASPAGDVAILAGAHIAIWNPARHRIERTLTGAPTRCDDVTTMALAFVGTAQHGRVVFGCQPSLVSWSLDSTRSTPAWRTAWGGPSYNDDPTPVVISPTDTTVAATVLIGTQFLDAKTGKLRATKALAFGSDGNDIGGVYSADGRTYAELAYTGNVEIDNPATGKLERTLVSSRGNVGDLGILCTTCGTNGGNPPAAAFSPDGRMITVWHDKIGFEIWDLTTGQSVAVLGGESATPLGTLTALQGTGTLDALFRHRLTVNFPSENSVEVSDVHDLVNVVNGAPTTDYTGRFRTVTFSLRPSDWVLAACSIVDRDLTLTEWKNLVSSTAPYEHTCTPLLTDTTRHG